MEDKELINAAMPKKSCIHISEYTGGLTNPRPDQVVYEDKCGAAVLMMEEEIKRISREQDLLLVPQGDMFVLVYRGNIKQKLIEVGKQGL